MFPFAWSVAILRYRVWDADRVLSRGALAATATAAVVIAYFATAFLAAGLAGDHSDVAGPVAAAVLVGLVFAAMCAGARGYLLEGADRVTMLSAIRAAARGEVLFSAGVAGRVLDFFRVDADAARRARPFPELTDREYEVLACIADGSTNEQAARQLGLSAKTVANNLSRVFTKLQVTDRAQAIVKVHRAGIGPEPRPGR